MAWAGLKKKNMHADGVEGYLLHSRSPERGLCGWRRVEMCNYKAGAQGFNKIKACYLQACDLYRVDTP